MYSVFQRLEIRRRIKRTEVLTVKTKNKINLLNCSKACKNLGKTKYKSFIILFAEKIKVANKPIKYLSDPHNFNSWL